MLEFKTTKQRYFYWIQEDDKEKDAELAQKVHNALNNIGGAGAGAGAGAAATGTQRPGGPTLGGQQPM